MSAAERLPCHGELQAALCTQYTCMPAHPQKRGLQSRCNAWGDKESLVTAAGHLPSKTFGVVQQHGATHDVVAHITDGMVWHQVSGQMSESRELMETQLCMQHAHLVCPDTMTLPDKLRGVSILAACHKTASLPRFN